MSGTADTGFAAFFEAVHGRQPFPWQERAAAHLARREVFGVDVPTGMGKSALVDAAVWAAAQGAWRRIAFVVDRRIVVDAVHERTLRIEGALRSPRTPALHELAAAIGEMQVVRLRGGVHGDDDWVLYPDRLSVVLTTVDQLGSRLLFRGYGVSPRRWPMHAAFFASDTLIVIDEAHLSTPLLQTLHTLQRSGADIAVLPMSATLPPEVQSRRTVSLDIDDLAVTAIAQRLAAVKRASLVECGDGADFIKTVVAHATTLARLPGVARLGIVVNRVESARRCFERLRSEGLDCALLTGRTRPAERDRRLADVLPRFETGRARAAGEALRVVVATQTIEVGADLDFDALVSEAAPLSSLRQRFGRLDRLGERRQSSAVIVCRANSRGEDPVYGAALDEAWQWLQETAASHGGAIDFGLDAMDALLRAKPAPVENAVVAATLLPTHIEMLAQTGPFAPELAVNAWLHGASDRAPDVSVVWRDDLITGHSDDWKLAAQLVPPMLREALPIGAAALRRFLGGAGSAPDTTSDLEGGPAAERDATECALPVLRWRGADDCEVVTAGEIRPGDTVMLPASYGGCDEWGWAPASGLPVADLADECLAEAMAGSGRRRPALRLAEGHWHAFGAAADGLRQAVATLRALEDEAASGDHDLDDELADARGAVLDAAQQSGHPLGLSLREASIERHPGGVVLRGRGIEEVAGVIEIGRPVTLDVHHADVARWAARLAGDHPHAAQIGAAAAVHDAGKREPRMQALLHGSPLAAAGGVLLAKSGLRRREQQTLAYRAASLPRGFRHEFASLEFETLDDSLTRHLVATHHGYGRPWLVPCADGEAAGARFARLDQHWADEWAARLAAQGPWALAVAEWLLRCADARASIEEAGASHA